MSLTLHTYQANASGFHVSATLITGEKDAMLIDAQYMRADAHRLVGDILDSGKRLTTVYISQSDPDYYFGLEVIKQAFPSVRILATRATVDHIKASLSTKLEVWSPILGANGPKHPIVPDVVAGNRLELEDHAIDILGADGPLPLYSFIWIPSLKAVLGGVRVFGEMHLWTTDAQTLTSRQQWKSDLLRMLALEPEVVVPGHARKGISMDQTSVHFSLAYLDAFEQELPRAKNATALINAMKQRYPHAVGDAILELGAKVNKGEMAWAPA